MKILCNSNTYNISVNKKLRSPSKAVIEDAANSLADFVNNYVDTEVSVISTRRESLDDDQAIYKVRFQDNLGNRFSGYVELLRDDDGEWMDAYDIYDITDRYMQFLYDYATKFRIDIID